MVRVLSNFARPPLRWSGLRQPDGVPIDVESSAFSFACFSLLSALKGDTSFALCVLILVGYDVTNNALSYAIIKIPRSNLTFVGAITNVLQGLFVKLDFVTVILTALTELLSRGFCFFWRLSCVEVELFLEHLRRRRLFRTQGDARGSDVKQPGGRLTLALALRVGGSDATRARECSPAE